MTGLWNLTSRHCRLFFKDKGMFFSALITPMILLVLYATFLAKLYRDSFTASLGGVLQVKESLIDATVGGQLVSSLLAVCCVTVAFSANMQIVQDRVSGARRDLTVTPVKTITLSLSYYLATAVSTMIICLIATGVGLGYLSAVGWYLSAGDVVLLFLDVFLLAMFGTALSSIVSTFLTSQGQISAIGTIVSAGYGFICGAYMPISQFTTGLQKAISFLPGTYGTSLLRNHTLNGVYREMQQVGFPLNVIEEIKDSIDCNLYFFGEKVTITAMYLILSISVIALIGLYIVINVLRRKKRL